MDARRFSLHRLIYDNAGVPTEVFVTDVPSLMAAHRHINDANTIYKVTDHITGARWIAVWNVHTAMVEMDQIGPKRFSRDEAAGALSLLGCRDLGAA